MVLIAGNPQNPGHLLYRSIAYQGDLGTLGPHKVEGPKVFRCVILLRSLIGEWQQMVSNHKGTQQENTFQVQQETCIKAEIKSKTSNPHISYLNHNLIFFSFNGIEKEQEKKTNLWVESRVCL